MHHSAEEIPKHWRIQLHTRAFLWLRLARKRRQSGVLVVARFELSAYSNGPYVGNIGEVTVDGRRKLLSRELPGPKFFDAKRSKGDTHKISLLIPDQKRFEFEVPVLDAPGKYLVYVEPERKDGKAAIAQIRRIV